GTDPSNGGQIPSISDQLQVLLVVIGAVVIGLAFLAGIFYRRHRDHDQHSRSPSDEPAITDPDPERTRETTESGALQTALLSNEEQVIRVLEHAGGRAKQQHVVEELAWTEAKTSQVVSDLRDDGTINSFRLGRENVLSLADTESEGDEPASG